MVQLTLLVTAALATTSYGFTWNNCKNADPCLQNPGMVSAEMYSSGEVTFNYNSDGYWYARKLDETYVSPTGFFHYGHGHKFLDVTSKNAANKYTSWRAETGSECCLPDEVGTNIENLMAFTG